MNTLPIQTARTFIIGAIALGVLLFLPAWTLAYWQAWVFIVVFMISVNVIGLYLSLKDPALLERRKKVGPAEEQSMLQRIIMSLAIIGSLALLVFCAFDHRFAWSPVPSSV
jgi:MFS superfamily sulfate permease-like transporter